MPSNMTKEEIRDSLADECNVTLEHANIHLQSALAAEVHGDVDQVVHDTDVASRILRYIVLDREPETESSQGKQGTTSTQETT